MTRFYAMVEDREVAARYGGDVSAAHKWHLPGIESCPGCGASWSESGHEYPAVDLSVLPDARDFEEPRADPIGEVQRLRERVRPLVPSDATLPPGTSFGPLVGTASGRFAPFVWLGDGLLLARRETTQTLQAAGLRGVLGCRTQLRFRQKSPPELLELQLEPRGQLYPKCLPVRPSPCTTCGRDAFRLPEAPVLDAASLPTDVDVFRVGNFATVIVGTDRFRDVVSEHGLEGIGFRELPTR
jgi:uncharacterized double-CXXCG motif protein